MRTGVLAPVGVEVTGLALDDLADGSVDRLRHLLAEHGVVVMPGQHIDDTAFAAFLARFGKLVFTTGEVPVPDVPDLNIVSNLGRTNPPRSTFHVDTSYVRRPPVYTALRAVQIPDRGGETLFSNQYRALDTLPVDVRARVEGRTIRHVVTGLDLGPEDEAAADHPVLLRHPLSRRMSLYLSTPARCESISGVPPEEGRALVELLFRHSTQEINIHRHAWSPGDVVMWDNRCVLHRADHAEVVGDRVMHRGMVA